MYTPEQISQVTGAPLANVQQSWPDVVATLRAYNINTHRVRIGVIGTIARETGVFLPIEEEGDQAYFERELGGQWWYHGRGYLQITWLAGYQLYGQKLGLDLVNHPELALQSAVAAKILCLYFIDRGIPAMCEAGNWGGVQTAVNGGWINWSVFEGVVNRLLAIPEPADGPPTIPVTTVGAATILRTMPVANGPHAKGTAHPDGLLPAGTMVTFCPDPSPGQYHGKETTPHFAHVLVGKGPMHGWAVRADLRTVGG